ncbi:MAG: DNA polymerase III subunit beta [Candidatus Hydrogenedentota bacterium]|nr:MAG: DNA polymerase III subunit beta [Candidatus Hydrogenedentota bacterium]
MWQSILQKEGNMRFRVKKDELQHTISSIEALAPKKTTQTILSHILLETSENELIMTASDMESSAQVRMPAEDTEKGGLIVSAKKLSEIAHRIQAEEIIFDLSEEDPEESIDLDEDRFMLNISGIDKKAARFTLSAGAPSNFPHFEMDPSMEMWQADVATIHEMIRKTVYAISQEDNRYIYNGLCFFGEGNKLTVVGTDGRRLSAITREFSTNIEVKDAEGEPIVVHSKAVKQLERLISDASKLGIGLSGRNVFFETDNAKLSSRLIEGKFPDYKKILPTQTNMEFEISREAFLDAISQVMVMCEPPSYLVKLSTEADTLHLAAHTPEYGSASVELPISSIGDPLMTAFNATFMTDLLNSLDCETVKLQFVDPERPIVIRDTSDPDFVSIVMPFRI